LPSLKRKRGLAPTKISFDSKDYEEKPDLRHTDSALVKSVLRSMAKRGVYLTTTRIQKLFYLIERECVLNIGRRCFRLDYRYDQYGMYSPQMKGIVNSLDPAKDHLVVKNFEGEKGMGWVVEFVGNESECDEIPSHVQDAVTKVISEYGFLRTDAMIREAKATAPFMFAKKGEYLDWSLLFEERCEPSEVLSPNGIARLTAASQFNSSRTFKDTEELNNYLFN
jgi:hypothetical protein